MTSIVPDWCSSSRLMHRMSVDLPEPEGPQITIFFFSLSSLLFFFCHTPKKKAHDENVVISEEDQAGV